MMTILTGLILFCALLFACTRRQSAPVIAVSTAVLALCGLYLLLVPGDIKILSRIISPPPGLTLLASVLLLLFVIVLADLYLRLRNVMDMLTITVRKLSLMELAQHTRNDKADND